MRLLVVGGARVDAGKTTFSTGLVERTDAFAVVEPGRVRVFDGDRYATGCAVAGGGPETGQLAERVGDVTDLIDPVTESGLPPLSADQRVEPAAVADAYEHAFDTVLATAFDR